MAKAVDAPAPLVTMTRRTPGAGAIRTISLSGREAYVPSQRSTTARALEAQHGLELVEDQIVHPLGEKGEGLNP